MPRKVEITTYCSQGAHRDYLSANAKHLLQTDIRSKRGEAMRHARRSMFY